MKFKNFNDIPLPEGPKEDIFFVRGGPFDLSWRFTFGRQYGQSLNSVIEGNPAYVRWCLENVAGFSISKAAREVLFDSEED